MFKIKIFNPDNLSEIFYIQIQNLDDLEEKLREGEDYNLWNVFDRIETIPAKKELRQNPDNPEEMIEVEIEPEQQIIHPATHRYEIIDITEQIQKEQALQKRARLRQAGEMLIDEISELNAKANITPQQLRIIMLDEDAAYVRELLWAGSLQAARQEILNKQEKFEQLFGVQNVQYVLDKINDVLNE